MTLKSSDLRAEAARIIDAAERLEREERAGRSAGAPSAQASVHSAGADQESLPGSQSARSGIDWTSPACKACLVCVGTTDGRSEGHRRWIPF